MSEISVIKRDTPTMYFVGVTTNKSSMTRIFPLWAKALGLDGAQLIGVDLPLRAPAEDYRRVVAQIKHDDLSLGALVTAHKIGLLASSRDLFDELDEYARLIGEVSCISKRDEQMIGHAKDVITVGLALERIVEAGYWAHSGAQLMCIGAGGAGAALATSLLSHTRPQDNPTRLLLVDRDKMRLSNIEAIHNRLPPSNVEVELVLSDSPQENDRLVGQLPPGSMLINATGMGKDLPGSPITGQGLFPEKGIVWEFNYRGQLDFLRQAKAQAETRQLSVHDGWHYFLVGWTAVIAEVFHLEISPGQFNQLATIAEANRG